MLFGLACTAISHRKPQSHSPGLLPLHWQKTRPIFGEFTFIESFGLGTEKTANSELASCGVWVQAEITI